MRPLHSVATPCALCAPGRSHNADGVIIDKVRAREVLRDEADSAAPIEPIGGECGPRCGGSRARQTVEAIPIVAMLKSMFASCRYVRAIESRAQTPPTRADGVEVEKRVDPNARARAPSPDRRRTRFAEGIRPK